MMPSVFLYGLPVFLKSDFRRNRIDRLNEHLYILKKNRYITNIEQGGLLMEVGTPLRLNHNGFTRLTTPELLLESAPLMWEWSRGACGHKQSGGGMEEWGQQQAAEKFSRPLDCSWYHGAWQYLRLLNMVAVPPWYEFYHSALRKVLVERPHARVLIAACADYGMLSTLHDAIDSCDASPNIEIYDICKTPLQSCEWYARRHGFTVHCVCDNLLTSASLPRHSFDLVVTDEFLTVIKGSDKPIITRRWEELLSPDGTLVTTAMIGRETTPQLRQGYAERAKRLIEESPRLSAVLGLSVRELSERTDRFADLHTRHMMSGEGELKNLFSDFKLSFAPTGTPGECVNPTDSFQIVACREAGS